MLVGELVCELVGELVGGWLVLVAEWLVLAAGLVPIPEDLMELDKFSKADLIEHLEILGLPSVPALSAFACGTLCCGLFPLCSEAACMLPHPQSLAAQSSPRAPQSSTRVLAG